MNIPELYELCAQCNNVIIDSRKVSEGDLFIGIKGPNFDGNQFAVKALDSGAKYAIVDDPNLDDHPNIIVVESSLITLQKLANHHRQQFDIPFIAITGTNGKTTTKELIHSILSSKFKTIATEGNLNNHLGVPLTLLGIPKGTEMAIIELGANHIGEIALLCEIVEPNYGIITNIGKAHLEGFGNLDGVRKGKGELYEYIRKNNGKIFRNNSLAYLEELAEGIEDQIKYGNNSDCNAKIESAENFLQIQLDSGQKVNSKLIGEYNLDNMLAAICVGRHFKVSELDALKALGNYEPKNNRSQIVKRDSITFILDAYNANPMNMRASIDNFVKMAGSNKVLILGDMMELGEFRQQEHRELLEFIEDKGFSKVILVGSYFEEVIESFAGDHFNNVEELISWFAGQEFSNSTILVKGSRAIGLEKLLE